jgi:hypothetical protein
MNNINFNLKLLEEFNGLNETKKNTVMALINLNKYKFLLDELKEIYAIIDDKKILEDRISKIFNEGCLNFNIINSIYSCEIYKGASYFLYKNTKTCKYYLYVLKLDLPEPTNSKDKDSNSDSFNFLEYIGKFKLDHDLIWKKLE